MWSISEIKLSSIEKIRIRSLRTQPLGFLRRKQTWNKSDRVRKGWRWKQQRKQQWRQEHLLARAKAFNLATVFIVSTACQTAATQGTHQYQSSHKGFELLKMRSKTSRSLTTAWHESWNKCAGLVNCISGICISGNGIFCCKKRLTLFTRKPHTVLSDLKSLF